MGRDLALWRDDVRRNSRRPAFWLDRPRGRWAAHEHPRRRPAPRGARLHLRAPARRECELYVRYGQVRRSGRVHQRYRARDDRAVDRVRISGPHSCPCPDPLRRSNSDSLSRAAVNIASAWLLSSGGHHPGHSHGGDHGHDEAHSIATPSGDLILEVFEDGRRRAFAYGRLSDRHLPPGRPSSPRCGRMARSRNSLWPREETSSSLTT